MGAIAGLVSGPRILNIVRTPSSRRTGAAIYVADRVPTFEDGVELAFETIKSGAARAKLDEFVKSTQAI